MFSPRFALCNANGHADVVGEGVGLEICRVYFNIRVTKSSKFKFGCRFVCPVVRPAKHLLISLLKKYMTFCVRSKDQCHGQCSLARGNRRVGEENMAKSFMFHYLHSSPNLIRVIESRKMRLGGGMYVTHMRDRRVAYRIYGAGEGDLK
jgi:hypothetical protein